MACSGHKAADNCVVIWPTPGYHIPVFQIHKRTGLAVFRPFLPIFVKSKLGLTGIENGVPFLNAMRKFLRSFGIMAEWQKSMSAEEGKRGCVPFFYKKRARVVFLLLLDMVSLNALRLR